MDSLVRNQTWTLVSNPRNRKFVSCKWILKKNEGILGVKDSRYKARLVARGFTQKEGVYFNEIFSHVVKHKSIRTLLAMVTLLHVDLEQMDIKTAFLHDNLEENILMSQPKGFKAKGHRDYICLLHKSLYNLKGSPRQCRRFDQFMISNGYYKSKYDSCVYHRNISLGGALYLLLYVDDILIVGKNSSDIEKLKNLLKGGI